MSFCGPEAALPPTLHKVVNFLGIPEKQLSFASLGAAGE